MGKNVVIGQRVKAMREDKKLSIEEVAARSGLNVEQIRKVEEHDGMPSRAPLTNIARVWG